MNEQIKEAQELLPSALVVCTRNRPTRVEELLRCLKSLAWVPGTVVLVDSSETDETAKVVANFSGSTLFDLIYLRSLSGAAHQKNVGMDAVWKKYGEAGVEVVHFLDDDITPNPKYFRACLELFKGNERAVVFGGFDQNLTKPPASRLRDALILADGNRHGVLLKSGICLVAFPESHSVKVDWVPGGMQNFRWSVASKIRFDGRVRIYGDEVEIQTRLAEFGDIYASSLLKVEHHSETIAKDSNRIEESYMDGFRWALARKFPQRVKRFAVLYTTIALAAGEIIRAIQRLDRLALTRFQGHIDFLMRLLAKKPIQQYVDHLGSGPFVHLPRD